MGSQALSTSTRQDEEASDSLTCAQGNALREHPKYSGYPPLRHGSRAEPDAPRNKSPPEPESGGQVPPHRCAPAQSAREPTPRRAKRRRRPYHDPGKTFQNMEMGKRCCTEHADSRPYSPFNLFRQRRKLRFGREKRQDALTRRIRRRAQLLRNGIEISLRNRSGKNECGCMYAFWDG